MRRINTHTFTHKHKTHICRHRSTLINVVEHKTALQALFVMLLLLLLLLSVTQAYCLLKSNLSFCHFELLTKLLPSSFAMKTIAFYCFVAFIVFVVSTFCHNCYERISLWRFVPFIFAFFTILLHCSF